MLARILITLATVFYAVGPLMADLNPTHILNPQWMPHARLHMVWALGTNTLIAVLALYLLWARSQLVLAAILGICVMIGFWVASMTRDLYGGSLTDDANVQAVALGMEANSFAFLLVTIALVLGLILHAKGRSDKSI